MDPDKKRPQDWLIVEDTFRYHIAIIDAKYDPDLPESTLNVRLQTSSFAADIVSTTLGYEACRLFEAQ